MKQRTSLVFSTRAGIRLALVTLGLAWISTGPAAAQLNVSRTATSPPVAPDPKVGVTNLGVSSFQAPEIDGNLVAFIAAEFQEGITDLNGDGDALDYVLHVYDRATGLTSNLGLASTVFDIDGNVVVFLVDEAWQGSTDLNGDGDAYDLVAHLYEAGPGSTTNLGLATSFETFGPRVSGNLITVPVDEFAQGGLDLNGDGDVLDQYVLHVHDIATGITQNLALATGFGPASGEGDLAAFPVVEYDQGQTDLNGDGDAFDAVLHIHDIGAGVTTNTGVAIAQGGPIRMSGGVAVVEVVEFSQGQMDLNGDGDASDRVAFLYDAAAALLQNLGLAVSNRAPDISGRWVVVSVSEASQGAADLNGDGDTFDWVEHVYDRSAGLTTNLGLSSDGFLLEGSLVAFRVWESGQGFTDLNGDGDTADVVLHVHETSLGATTNLGLAAEFDFQLSRSTLAFRVAELAQAGTDLNGDGDLADAVLHVFDAFSGSTANVALSQGANGIQVAGRVVAFEVDESSQGSTVLNGDGDHEDEVLHVYNTGDGSTVNLGLAVDDFRISRRVVAFEVDEAAQGQTDLNGDLDALDDVVHVTRMD